MSGDQCLCFCCTFVEMCSCKSLHPVSIYTCVLLLNFQLGTLVCIVGDPSIYIWPELLQGV